jgi:hydroxymethylpyrimidine/phosphomethylpyrimidine kinase
VVLSVAGTDSGGGAGIAADLRTFAAFGVWGAVAVTAVTAQDTEGVHAVERVSPAVVRAQIEAVATDIGVDGAKTGMLAGPETVVAVARAVADLHVAPLVVDPVAVASTGASLLAAGGTEAIVSELLPLATVVTPNLSEASALLGGGEITTRAAMEEAGRALAALGPEAVLVTGGHLAYGNGSPDVLVMGGEVVWLEGERLASPHTHGTGCVLSAAVAACLATGLGPAEACARAKGFVRRAIAGGVQLGRGAGAVDPGAVDPGAVDPGAGVSGRP